MDLSELVPQLHRNIEYRPIDRSLLCGVLSMECEITVIVGTNNVLGASSGGGSIPTMLILRTCVE
jgi:hypothetical protein